MNNLQQITKKYFRNYQVQDVLPEATEVLFILESPHTQEIKYGYPVAGNSGREMTKFIYDQQKPEPFGKLVANAEEYKTTYQDLTRFGLLNVCPAPMQKQALQEFELSSAEKQVIAVLEKLRVNYKAVRHQKQDWNLIKELIIEDFKTRLREALTNYSNISYLVPCGKFAANYLELIGDELTTKKPTVITEIPHPSFNQWHSYETMEKLRRILNE